MAIKENLKPFVSAEVFLDRLKVAGLDQQINIWTPSNSTSLISQSRSGAVNLARLDGAYFYKMTYENFIGFLRQSNSRKLRRKYLFKPFNIAPIIPTLIINRRLNKANRQLLDGCDGVVFQSEISKKVHELFVGYRQFKVPERVIYNGVDLESFSPSLNPFCAGGVEFNLLISASLYRPNKRLRDAILILNEIVKRGRRVLLHVLGDLDELSKDSLTGLDISSCRFHGKVSLDSLPDFYRFADAQLSMCLFDSCPNVVSEGLACGLPVVTPLQSGAAELVGAENSDWVVDEGVPIEYWEAHRWTKIPMAPVEIYANKIESILDNLKVNKDKARWRAERELNIRNTAKLYNEFAAKIRESRL